MKSFKQYINEASKVDAIVQRLKGISKVQDLVMKYATDINSLAIVLLSLPLVNKLVFGATGDKLNNARLIAQGLARVVLGEEKINESKDSTVKGWVHLKTKKVYLTKRLRPYHVEFIVKKPRDFGTSEKDILKVLEDYNYEMDAVDAKYEAEKDLAKIKSGDMDMQKLVEYLAMKKGWYRVVGNVWASEIAGAKINDKIIHDVLNIMEDEGVIPYDGQGIKQLECREYQPDKNNFGYPDSKLVKLLVGDKISRALRGKKTGDKRTEIGTTMAMFRGEAVEGDCQVYTAKQIKDLEIFADRLLNKFGIDIEFTKHFRDRMNDTRNRPCIKISELQQLFKKMNKAGGKRIKGHGEGQAVVLDIQRDLNLPVVIDMKKNGDFEVRAKTIMRKKNFRTSNKKILY